MPKRGLRQYNKSKVACGSGMANEQEFEYFILQYAPNLLSENTISIGVVLLDSREPESGLCLARFSPGWQAKVMRTDPKADLEVLEVLAREIEQSLSSRESRIGMIAMMENTFSNTFRVSERCPCRTQNPLLLMEQLLPNPS